MQTISILGCGWLGLPLGARLAAQGYAVKGSTTSPEKKHQLRAAGIAPYRLRLDPDFQDDPGDFFASDVLFLNLPPGRRRPDVETRYPAQIDAVRRAVREAAAVRLVVFASSTSVYPSERRLMTEADAGEAPTASGRALLVAEQRLQADDAFATTILRYGGLYGYDRQPGRFLAGRTALTGAEAPVNLVHRDDAVAVAEAVIAQDVAGEVFSVVADAHPTKRVFYTWAAERLGLPPPTFEAGAGGSGHKTVSNARLKERLGYAFRHPDPMAGE